MNSKRHLVISFFKSLIRISACIGSIINNNWVIIPIGFGIAEILGIAEELFDER